MIARSVCFVLGLGRNVETKKTMIEDCLSPAHGEDLPEIRKWRWGAKER